MLKRDVYVSATIYGDNLDPDFWSTFFDALPETVAKRGGAIFFRGHKRGAAVANIGLWGFSTKEYSKSQSLDEHLAILDRELRLTRPELRTSLAARGELLKISYYINEYELRQPSKFVPVLEPASEAILESCGAKVEFDIYPQIIKFIHPDGREEDMLA